MNYEVRTNIDTIWINGDSGFLGRFNSRFRDVHSDSSKCCGCGSVTDIRQDWQTFVKDMEQIHGIRIEKSWIPEKIREAIAQ